MKIKYWFIVLFATTMFAMFLDGCNPEKNPVRIAISYTWGPDSANNYIKWLKRADPEINYMVFYNLPPDSVDYWFDRCSGLLLTGGEDVYPAWYGKEADTARCGEFDHYRDTLEMKLIKKAIAEKMPVMGVCRGMQILNVALGGSLYVDIPTDINTMVAHRCQDWQNCFHRVNLLPGNLLGKISGADGGRVTTNHHQALDRVAEPLRVFAVADDGIIEAVGYGDTLQPFLLAVQWHPERMDTLNPLSMPLVRRFVEEAVKFHEK